MGDQVDTDKLFSDITKKPSDASAYDYGSIAFEAFESAYGVVERIPMAWLSGSMRDNLLLHLFGRFEAEARTRAHHCPDCQSMAMQMAMAALGWEDMAHPRGNTPKERMDALLEQFSIAMAFMEQHHVVR